MLALTLPSRRLYVAFLCAAGLLACGDRQGGGAAVGERSAPPASRTISRASVESCGGFTVEKAAEILGVPAAGLVDKSEWASWSDQQRQCLFRDRQDVTGPSVWFNLTIEESAAVAGREMARLHENSGIASKSIDAVSGTTSQEIDDAAFAGIADEAFWVAATDALAIRVGNVTALIGVRGVAEPVEKTKTVAREVAAGLG